MLPTSWNPCTTPSPSGSSWAETRSSWNDERAREFEEKYLFALEQDLRNAVGAMDHMAVYLSQVKRDCDD